MPAEYTFYSNRANSTRLSSGDRFSLILRGSRWDDYGFGTTFALYLIADSEEVYLGSTKLAKKGMASLGAYAPTNFTPIPEKFNELDADFFSVGQDANFYANLVDRFGSTGAKTLLRCLRDMVAMPSIVDNVLDEPVAQRSLFRTITLPTVRDQYSRILAGGTVREKFALQYRMHPGLGAQSPSMRFEVDPDASLPSNVHVIIGANGTGKTSTIRNIRASFDRQRPLDADSPHFSISDSAQIAGLLSVSFSAFDPLPNLSRDDRAQAVFRVTNVGLRGDDQQPEHVDYSDIDLQQERYSTLIGSSLNDRSDRLLKAFAFLAEADSVLESHSIDTPKGIADLTFRDLSSGHKIVLLTLASVVRFCEEKTLVLIDEPESHLHPPLLGAFTRALSWLMTDTNSLAIVATHSPVVLQEVPARCAWKVWKSGAISDVDQPSIQTFGENLGVLTREVFGLEMDKSGYHAVLQKAADDSADYPSALASLNGEIGEEAKLILRSMVRRRSGTSR